MLTSSVIYMGAALAGLLLAVFGIDVLLSPAKTLKITLFHPYRRDGWPQGVQEEDNVRFDLSGPRPPAPPIVPSWDEITATSGPRRHRHLPNRPAPAPPTPRSRRRRATPSWSSPCTPRSIEPLTDRPPNAREVAHDAHRHPGLGPGCRLLSDLPGPVRRERPRRKHIRRCRGRRSIGRRLVMPR